MIIMVLLNLMGSSDNDIFQPDTKWWNKEGLLYTVNEDGTILTDHQNNTSYNIEDIIP